MSYLVTDLLRNAITAPNAMIGGPSPSVHHHGKPACQSIRAMIAPKTMFMTATNCTIVRYLTGSREINNSKAP
jgi:hypothetical protein